MYLPSSGATCLLLPPPPGVSSFKQKTVLICVCVRVYVCVCVCVPALGQFTIRNLATCMTKLLACYCVTNDDSIIRNSACVYFRPKTNEPARRASESAGGCSVMLVAGEWNPSARKRRAIFRLASATAAAAADKTLTTSEKSKIFQLKANLHFR